MDLFLVSIIIRGQTETGQSEKNLANIRNPHIILAIYVF